MSEKTKQSVINLPSKLPMVCKSKPYGVKKTRCYFLNDEKFADKLFLEKKAYGFISELSDKNKIYTMVNKLAFTLFKINHSLLDNITGEESKHNLLISAHYTMVYIILIHII